MVHGTVVVGGLAAIKVLVELPLAGLVSADGQNAQRVCVGLVRHAGGRVIADEQFSVALLGRAVACTVLWPRLGGRLWLRLLLKRRALCSRRGFNTRLVRMLGLRLTIRNK